MNYVNTQHALQYFHHRLEYWQGELEKSQALYDAARAKYEAGLWFRVFGTPFEKTDAGDTSWLSRNNWQMPMQRARIKDVKQCIACCVYHIKTEDESIAWMFRDFYVTHFYTWAQKNNIPY